jgi:glycosyltransferase involved in cell wall biosynthesis
MSQPNALPSAMTKLLIVRPDASRLGGIEGYFLKLCPYLTVSHESFGIARRPHEHGLIARVLRILTDYARYWARLSDSCLEIVHLNPSLEPKSFFREAIFMLLARLRRKKTVVFFRGWNPDFEQRLDRGGGRLFRLLYGGADAYIVLADQFAAALRRWGIVRPIHREVVIIEDEAVAAFDLERALQHRLAAPHMRVLFASRLLRSKGLITTIQALRIIQRTHPDFELMVAGEGEVADEARTLVQRLQIANVSFLGVVSGPEKYELFRTAHVLCLPTEHAEGFPNVIVEAMAFGLPVVTRPVGGIPALCHNGVHGYLTESTAAEDFAALILRIGSEPERYRRMAETSHRDARRLFLASDAGRRMDRIYASLFPPAHEAIHVDGVTEVLEEATEPPDRQ